VAGWPPLNRGKWPSSKPRFAARDIEFTVHSSLSHSDHLVPFHSLDLHVILESALTNAFDAAEKVNETPYNPYTLSQKIGEVDLSIELKDKKYLITIRDSGNGFKEGVLENILDKNIPTTTKPDGHGFGILNTYKLLRTQNGDLQFKRIADFTYTEITLPLFRQGT
jgi:sensor histidine kinase regulating citrate/malate metabolism